MNAVIYARYSSYNQTERSIEGQIEDCMAYAERMGYTVIGSYIDRAKSGTDADHRADFQRMVNDSRHKTFDTVLVWKYDRFARNRFDSAKYKHKLKKNGVKLISVNEPISDDPSGILIESMLEGQAEYYSANLSQNVKRGNRVALEKGFAIGGRTPYGYKLIDKRPVIDEQEARNVQYIFESFRDDVPSQQIADTLNASGYKTHSGTPFTKNSFQTMLRSRRYIGEYEINGTVYPDIYPRIIDDALFAAVQKKIERHKQAPAAAKAKVSYDLQGKIFCGHCGAAMIGESGRSRTGDVHHYYTCAARKKSHTCKKRNERKDNLEYYLVEQTMLHVLTKDNIEKLSKALVKKYEEEYSQSGIAELERIIARLDREIDDAVDSFIAARGNKMMQDRITEKVDTLSAQKDDAVRDLSAAKIAAAHTLSLPDIRKWLSSFTGGDPLSPEYRRRVIDTFINAIYLFDDRLVVYYNITDAEQVTYTEMQSDLSDSDFFGSDLDAFGQPIPNKSEHFLIKASKLFGFLKRRSDG